ncbi:hypothetical protein H310_12587 [Aphanomyces invadans]|uniref:Uncharacterized protein n=1 Tax=Aphanomyces invadans TaxID=157072 RepID=A0A024TJR4_9STRA|nr:hypothetical protein H310_12587 [Aphanomyces invadans]ETV93592.1 hypothetical protein H310_12587 [Aphanomyces invadans]|eukprot:XP_008877934.1 hypothetical protein H310_12587 [Aphanomyces invadans]
MMNAKRDGALTQDHNAWMSRGPNQRRVRTSEITCNCVIRRGRLLGTRLHTRRLSGKGSPASREARSKRHMANFHSESSLRCFRVARSRVSMPWQHQRQETQNSAAVGTTCHPTCTIVALLTALHDGAAFLPNSSELPSYQFKFLLPWNKSFISTSY